ncbi:hypothetical protein [Chondromyces crocatus]|uniref:Uncharacterized protein n=1 Tax=Chondromyces crocatus TaxID=52 RepID=A0A0K1EPD6_CHOCO|nr:hypothetical protein [Chondromyces crocatus]AKT42711.1 uncharacterized protein CMC5_069380 [Chondromyces crocatus]
MTEPNDPTSPPGAADPATSPELVSPDDARADAPSDAPSSTLQLAGGHALEVRRGPGNDTLQLLQPDGQASISIHVTPQGITLSVQGAALTLHATGALAIDAETLALRGRSGVAIESGGDAHIDLEGDLHARARQQHLTATLGNVNIKANDDVKLDGERIKLNS